jgi:3-deoxy-7-phosphoheptulonate synthase
MLIIMRSGATPEEIDGVVARIRDLGMRPHSIPGSTRTAIGITGNPPDLDPAPFEALPGVIQALRVSKPYKLVSRETKLDDTIVRIPSRGIEIGGRELVVMAGPCSVESRDQILAAAEAVSKAGARILRGGAYKPRTSPYSFQGLEEEGLKLLAEAGERFGLATVTEVINEASADLAEDYVDVLQVGARNMQNFALLKRLSRSRKPVLLKRGMSATLEELLMCAEYLLAGGNYDVILCERGVRTFADHTRNTFDVSIIPAVKKASHLPIIGDPSHGTGIRDMVPSMARAAIAAGADGLIVEVHPNPAKALSDGAQSLHPHQIHDLMESLRIIAGAVGRSL